jgi:hypothetical protein
MLGLALSNLLDCDLASMVHIGVIARSEVMERRCLKGAKFALTLSNHFHLTR